MTTTPAAWHPDPGGRHELRYWNGTEWTEHVSDAGVTGIDPPPTGSAAAAGSVSDAGPSTAAPTTDVSTPGFGTRPASSGPPIGGADPGPVTAPLVPPAATPYATAPSPEFPGARPPAGPPRNRTLAWVAFGGAALVFVSTFLNWRTLDAGIISLTQSGNDLDLGTFNVLLAAVVAGLALWQIVGSANVAAKVLVIWPARHCSCSMARSC